MANSLSPRNRPVEEYDYEEIKNFIEQPEKTYRDIISKLEKKTALKMQEKRKNSNSDKKYNKVIFDYSKVTEAAENSAADKTSENYLTVEKYVNRLQMPISEPETETSSASVHKFFADLSNAETKKTNFWLEKRDQIKMSKRYQDIKKYTQGIQHLSQT